MLEVMAVPDQRGDHVNPGLTFPDVPQLALDELLVQLIARAGDVASAQGRLRGLLRANRAIAGNLELPVVLRHIVEAACDLVGARYGALGVIGPDGRLEQFIHVGMPATSSSGSAICPKARECWVRSLRIRTRSA